MILLYKSQVDNKRKKEYNSRHKSTFLKRMRGRDMLYEYMHSPRDESFLIYKKMIFAEFCYDDNCCYKIKSENGICIYVSRSFV